MNMSALVCQTHWVCLCQQFSKEREQRELETRNGAGKPTRQKWPLFDHLNFLGQFVFQRNVSNVGATSILANQPRNVQYYNYQNDNNVKFMDCHKESPSDWIPVTLCNNNLHSNAKNPVH
ncbi:uncharacterized protein LOC109503750 isoform X2 [Harpegnathos saltator]|uniref:uncharacterized protein LOC109503750 isoform X2 n=1 Tax=Harpegnathos saltator TaxID=610380 RepID=UPI000DBEDE5D|nr:uncharacterized protein LOC109503750 isoform X2 [Harpegnathos saltator]